MLEETKIGKINLNPAENISRSVTLQNFIIERGIKDEDVGLIDSLASFPKDMIIMELHNTFNMLRERASNELENLIQNTKDEKKKEMYQIALKFCNKYNWAVSYSLIRKLEGEL